MARTFVVGLDGASWRLLDPWIEAGTLPNLASLRDESAWARSRSCLPPVTFPNWKCYSAGKDPGGFGVFWFESVDLAEGRIDVPDRRDFRTAELWDYLNDAGLTTGVINMPTMYPPPDVDGVVVAGGPDAVDGEYRSIETGYASPPSLATELEDRFDYSVHPEPLLSSNEERGAEVEAILDLLETRFEVALTVFEERDLDFCHVTLFYLNVLHHFFWDDEPTERAWRLVDEWVGRLLALEDTNLVLFSDHGSAPTTTEFYVNEWLADRGYQSRSTTVDDYLQRVGIDREAVLGIAKRVGAVDLLARVVPDRVQRLVPQRAGLKRERKLEAIDLANTAAVASGQGPIYLNPDFETESLRADLVAELEAVSDDEGPLFADVHRGEECYEGPYLDEAPDIVLEQRPGVHVNDGVGGGHVRTEPDRWAAENTPNGIFLASGPDVETTGRLEGVRIVDIAPTLLAASGCAVPTDMVGEVLPILDDDSPADREPLEANTGERDGPTGEVSERLQQLGYME